MKIEKTYVVLKESEDIIRKLKINYPGKFSGVDPEKVGIVAIENFDRKETSQIIAKIIGIKEPQALFSTVKYIIELYLSDWVQWSPAQKAMVIARQLYHVDLDCKGTIVDYEIKDFKDFIKKWGVDYLDNPDIPNLSEEIVDW